MKISILVLILLTNFSFADNNEPEVSNVTFTQRADSSLLVDIYYDITDSDGDMMTVTMQVSANAGSSWLYSCQNTTGDVGSNIPSGSGKHIIWNFPIEHPQAFGDQFIIKIIADDHNLSSGTVTDIDGNIYQTIKIGHQWWMAENLKVSRYQNRDTIPNVTNDTEWFNLTSGAWCNYENDESNVETYGRLFNWYAVNDSRKIAPEDWRVASDADWKQLEMYLGMIKSEADALGMRGWNVGGKFKEAGTEHWTAPNYGATNESGFTALPGGYHDTGTPATESFFDLAKTCYFWTSTGFDTSLAYLRFLGFGTQYIMREKFQMRLGYSVRCVVEDTLAESSFDVSGIGTLSTVTSIEDENTILIEYFLNQNYPNPFNPITTISYSLPKTEHIRLEVFDISGKSVSTLVNEKQQVGTYTVRFDGSILASGIYVYNIKTDTFESRKKMILLK